MDYINNSFFEGSSDVIKVLKIIYIPSLRQLSSSNLILEGISLCKSNEYIGLNNFRLSK